MAYYVDTHPDFTDCFVLRNADTGEWQYVGDEDYVIEQLDGWGDVCSEAIGYKTQQAAERAAANHGGCVPRPVNTWATAHMTDKEREAFDLGWQHGEYNATNAAFGRSTGFYGSFDTPEEIAAYERGYQKGYKTQQAAERAAANHGGCVPRPVNTWEGDWEERERFTREDHQAHVVEGWRYHWAIAHIEIYALYLPF